MAKHMTPLANTFDFDSPMRKCTKATIAQIIIKIGEKQQKYAANPEKEVQINLCPAEKYALQDILLDNSIIDEFICMICEQILIQLDASEINNNLKRLA